MRTSLFLSVFLAIVRIASGQNPGALPETKIMTLGVFHFAYYNADAAVTEEKDKISVLDEPYQSEIIAIANAISEFGPTIIAVEATPDKQNKLDSLYMLYKAGKLEPRKDETFQLGFRIAKNRNLNKVYCVDDWGKHYDNVEALLNDSVRLSRLEAYIENSPDTIYKIKTSTEKVASIIDDLYYRNEPGYIKERLAPYLLIPFKFEEQPGDFTGADFETGRWFNRNLRIFRNVQRIPHTASDRILLITGSDHLNLLNLFFDVSKEFELISPLPSLDVARKHR